MMTPEGGISLQQTNVKATGSGVKTAFSDPAMLAVLEMADGLGAIVYSIKPVTLPMMTQLLGLSA